jgi:hypothetical protein
MSAGSSQRRQWPRNGNSDLPVRAARRRRRRVDDGDAGAKQCDEKSDVDSERPSNGRAGDGPSGDGRSGGADDESLGANERWAGARRGPMTRPRACEGRGTMKRMGDESGGALIDEARGGESFAY